MIGLVELCVRVRDSIRLADPFSGLQGYSGEELIKGQRCPTPTRSRSLVNLAILCAQIQNFPFIFNTLKTTWVLVIPKVVLKRSTLLYG